MKGPSRQSASHHGSPATERRGPLQQAARVRVAGSYSVCFVSALGVRSQWPDGPTSKRGRDHDDACMRSSQDRPGCVPSGHREG